MFAKIRNWLTNLTSQPRFSSMNINESPQNWTTIAVCQNCGAENRIPTGTNPQGIACGRCHQLKLVPKHTTQSNNTGTMIATSAVGTAVGSIFGAPGAIIGGVAGAIIGTFIHKPNDPKQ